MKAITQEVRRIIIEAKERGENVKTIAMWAKVTPQSMYNIITLYKKQVTLNLNHTSAGHLKSHPKPSGKYKQISKKKMI